MPVQIRIPSNNRTVWIENCPVRVGSDINAGVRIASADVASYAATVDYRNGSYYVWNRSPGDLLINSQPLPPNENSEWPDGATLTLTGGTELVLELSGDGAPAPMVNSHQQIRAELDEEYENQVLENEVEQEKTEPEVKPGSEGSMLSVIAQCVFIVLCLLGAVVVLYTQVINPGEPAMQSSGDVTSVMKQLKDEIEEQADDKALTSHLNNLLTLLREAELAMAGGKTERARRKFFQLRSQLLKSKQAGGELTDGESGLLDHVLTKIEVLSKVEE